MHQVITTEGLRQHTHQGVGHPLGHLGQIRTADFVAQRPLKARLTRQVLACRFQTGQHIMVVHHHQAPAQMHGSGSDQLAVLHQAELGGAAANIDVQDTALAVIRALGRARAIHGQHGLHVVTGGGTNELAALLGQHGGDGPAVFTPHGFTGEDHRARIHLVRVQTRGTVSAVDDAAQRLRINQGVAQIGREGDRRLVERGALHHGVAAGQIFGDAAQVDAREHHLRARGADVDAHAVQDDIILPPERLLLRVIAREITVVVMVVVGIAVMAVEVVLAQLVILDGVQGLVVALVVCHGGPNTSQ